MSQRLVGVVLALLLSLAAMAGPALAAEGAGEGEEGPAPRTVEEVVADNDTARQFAPEPYEQPTWFPIMRLPLMIVGVLVSLAVLFAFLLWQPRFAQERQEKSRRR
jgi:hypothetical protein